jgi:hypothetical protein
MLTASSASFICCLMAPADISSVPVLGLCPGDGEERWDGIFWKLTEEFAVDLCCMNLTAHFYLWKRRVNYVINCGIFVICYSPF